METMVQTQTQDHDQSDEAINAMMWAFVAEHYDSITEWCTRAARGNETQAEELFSDQVLRMLPDLLRRWDRVRPFFYYAKSYFGFHLTKWVRRANTRRTREGSYDAFENFDVEDTSDSNLNELERSEYLNLLLDELNPIDRIIVYRTVVLGETSRELESIVPYAWTTICTRKTHALNKLKRIAIERGYSELFLD